MKKLYFFIIFLLFIAQGFASEQVNIDSSRDTILLWESFRFTISIDESGIQNAELGVDIPGIENFQVFSQTQGTNYQDINGEVTSLISYSLDLQAIAIGKYTLWPVRILADSGDIIDDESIIITVSDTMNAQQLDISDLEKEETSLKGERKTVFPLSWGIFIIVLISVILYLFFSKNNNSLVENTQIDTQWKREDYHASIKKYFQDLSGEQEILESRIYFKKYNFGLRELLKYSGLADAQKLTLTELKKIENISENEVFKLLKKSYKYEYSDIDISRETRIKYMWDIFKLLKK